MIDMSIELMKLDFPEPVAPATSRCGILVRSAVDEMALPSFADAGEHRGFGSFIALSERSTSPRWTIRGHRSGLMPIADFPGSARDA